MALRKKAPPPEPRPRAVVAAAMRFDFQGGQTWQSFRGSVSTSTWQRDAWYQYDICGELRYAVNLLGSAMSRASMYVADVNPDTGEPAQPTDNERAKAIGAGILGGPAQRSQALKTLAVNLLVPGEVFVLVRAGQGEKPDKWLMLSTEELTGSNSGLEYIDPDTGKKVKVTSDDLLIRVWSPHPRSYREADSAVRALLPTLREVERTSQNIAARLDSRLASAGILLLPQEVDFPRDDEDSDGPDGFMKLLARSMTAALAEPGNASSQVPIVVEVPGEYVDRVTHLTFDSPVSSEVTELRERAIRRLATGLDMPGEVLTGMSESNHWTAWQIDEALYKTHLAPALDRIADALTQAYLIPALTAAKVPNPDSYMVAFDVSELVSRADKLADTLRLYDLLLVSDNALAATAGISDDERPDEAETLRRRVEALVKAAPVLLSDPRIAEILGIPTGQAAATQQPATEPAPEQPAIEPAPGPTEAQAGPGTQAPPEQPDQVAAAALAASIAVEHALAKAGARLLNANRLRGQYTNVPQHEIHTRVRPGDGQVDSLLAGAWDGAAAELAHAYRLDGYTRLILAAGVPHDEVLMVQWMRDTVHAQPRRSVAQLALAGGRG